MTFNHGDLVARKETVGVQINDQNYPANSIVFEGHDYGYCDFAPPKDVSYWIPIEEATLLRSTFEDTKELIRTWVRLRYDMEIRGELPDQLDALAKKLGY